MADALTGARSATAGEMSADADDDASARRWAEEARRQAEAGKLADDSDYVAEKLAEEKRKLKRP